MPPHPPKPGRPNLALSRRTLTRALLLTLLCPFAIPAAPKPRPTDPILSLPLESLGYLSAPPHTLATSFYTLHFVDSTHLLFTFNSRGLLTRLPDATPEDDDRNVTALLIDISDKALPSGKILARTVWRTRDRDQYLWPLTHGRFLLRIRNRLTVIQPLENLGRENPFAEQPFLEMKRRIGFVAISPGGDLLTVETVPPRPSNPTEAQIAAALAAQAQALGLAQTRTNAQAQPAYTPQLHTRTGAPLSTASTVTTTAAPPTPPRKPASPPDFEPETPGRLPVDLHFFRLFIENKPGEPARLAAQSAGILASRNMVNLPTTAEGFLETLKESPTVYNFDFQSHTGKRIELSAYDTTCAPRPYFVSRSEFVAFGCHGSADKIQISGFNLRGEEPWVSVFSGPHIAPAIVTAPDASRFALSRILISPGGVYDLDNIGSNELTGQEITVTQNHDGRTLLKLQVTPVQRSSQNFDLSPDGLLFTVVRGPNIELYRLPPLSPADQKDLQLALAAAPEKNDLPIRLLSTKNPTSAPAAEALTISTGTVDNPAPPPPTPAATVGDVHPTDGTRKAPTLYDPDHPKPPTP